MKSPKALNLEPAKYLGNPRMIAQYLNEALASGDGATIRKAIADMVRAQGVAGFCRKTGLGRESFYKSFNGKTGPAFDTVLDVLIGLKVQLIAKPSVELVDLGLKRKK